MAEEHEMRAYTVKELDALRYVVENKWLFGAYDLMTLGGHSYTSASHYPGEKTKAVEEMVRTHMLAGHTAEDLVASERPLPHPTSTEG